MKQLILPVAPDERATFENFISGKNAAAVTCLRDLVTVGFESQMLIWGPPLRGKSHLLQAACLLATSASRRARYFPLGSPDKTETSLLADVDDLDLLCVDDIHRVVQKPSWAESLFHLINDCRSRGIGLVFASEVHPGAEGIPLPDLASRLLWGPVFRLHALPDEALLEWLRTRAQARGFEIPIDAAQYLLSRCRREVPHLLRIVDSLDTETLAHQRRVTVPFIKAVLEL